MDDTGGPKPTQRRRGPGVLLGVLTIVAIAAAACGIAAAVSVSPAGQPSATTEAGSSPDRAADGAAVDPQALPSPDPNGDAGQQFAAADASVEFDTAAFAEIKPGGPRDVDPRRFRQLLDRDHIVPIYDPLVVSADEAAITPDELVMGVALNGEARAYPVGMMRSREIANDELGGVPILVTW